MECETDSEGQLVIFAGSKDGVLKVGRNKLLSNFPDQHHDNNVSEKYKNRYQYQH